MIKRYIPLLFVFGTVLHAGPVVELSNHQSGISLSLSGTNGTDWALEQTYQDAMVADLVLYTRDKVQFSLAHNDHNTVANIYVPNRLIGQNGPDGQPGSGDEGIIHYKINRDMQAHAYAINVPDWAPEFKSPFSFATLTYDGDKKVLGAVGDNGGKWGTIPCNTTERFYYGTRDAYGNEWHSLSYWDDDVELLKKLKVDVHRQGASDGHFIAVCVNPLTPVLQFSASGAEQYYTSPAKICNVPAVWDQITYLTSGVRVHFVNLTNGEPVFYRIGGGAFQKYAGNPLKAGDLFKGGNSTHVLEAKCGEKGVVYRRSIVFEPAHPAPAENHGYLLWKDEDDRQATVKKLLNVDPFKKSYAEFCGNYNQGMPGKFEDARDGWCQGALMASQALANAFVMAVEGPETRLESARLAKTRLLRMARLQPLGAMESPSSHTPGKDFMNELGQTMHQFADAGVAYDLLAGFYRSTQHPEGMTPVEEWKIRDGLAKIAHALLGQMRENMSYTIGGGDTHWGYGYEIAAGTIALAMPTYKTPYYGVSGGDRKTVNDFPGRDGKFWNPYPDQKVTWYQVATDPFLPSPGWPNSRAPLRAEFLLSDDGWWTGPNDMQGDGDRYVTGPLRRMLVDVPYGGLANAECRVELVEMSGYESPFVTRCYAFDTMRKIKGDSASQPSTANYIRRRLTHGVVSLSWNKEEQCYTAASPDIGTALGAFNKYYDFAGLPAPREKVAAFLKRVNIFYGVEPGELDEATKKQVNESDRRQLIGAYPLAYCANPPDLPESKGIATRRPLLKPLMKYVVKPGTRVVKDIIAMDPNGEPVELLVENLPAGATFDSKAAQIRWTPKAEDEGVHLLRVAARNKAGTTTRPFPLVVKSDAGKGTVPKAPPSLTATLGKGNASIELAWPSPENPDQVHSWFLYRDGIFFVALPAEAVSFSDSEYVSPGTHTRYHLSYIDKQGSESPAVEATGGYVTVPAK